MRVNSVFLVAVLVGSVAYGELLNVEVGGQMRIRGRYWSNTLSNGLNGPADERIPLDFLPLRAIGPTGTASRYDWDERGNDVKYFEQKTRLNVRALFTEDVSTFIELESFDRWGTDFRSDYLTGADFSANSVDDVEVLHAYIQLDKMLETPFRLRVGRQDIKLGKGWLVNDLITACISMSHDAIRLTYDTEALTVDTWMSKLSENSPLEEDGDVTFSGVYGTYKSLEHVDLSAYWLWVRDPRSLNDTNASFLQEWIENWLDFDDYDPTNLHTVGVRAWGKYEKIDYDLELAYQFGNADAVGFGFKTRGYGDHKARFGNWAGDVEVGYTFDVPWSPRVFLGAAYFEGEDNRDITPWEMMNPFDRAEASVSFNRLFSGKGYAWTYDVGQDTTNFHQFRTGVDLRPRDNIAAQVMLSYQAVNEPFDLPRMFSVGHYRVPIFPDLAFWTKESSRDMGFMTYAWIQYNYTDDLFIKVGWEHLFTGEAFEDGSFTSRHGLEFNGGTGRDDADYLFFDMGITF